MLSKVEAFIRIVRRTVLSFSSSVLILNGSMQALYSP